MFAIGAATAIVARGVTHRHKLGLPSGLRVPTGHRWRLSTATVADPAQHADRHPGRSEPVRRSPIVPVQRSGPRRLGRDPEAMAL